MRFDAKASCDTHTASGVSGDAADGATADADLHVASTSASLFEGRRCFALTFALFAMGTAAGLAAVGAFAAIDVSSGEIPVVTTEPTANWFFQEEHDAFARDGFKTRHLPRCPDKPCYYHYRDHCRTDRPLDDHTT